MSEQENRERLLRAIRTLQLLQRTNAPNSVLAKAVSKALSPLLAVQAAMPLVAPKGRPPAQPYPIDTHE
jgi:hypothetical protein